MHEGVSIFLGRRVFIAANRSYTPRPIGLKKIYKKKKKKKKKKKIFFAAPLKRYVAQVCGRLRTPGEDFAIIRQFYLDMASRSADAGQRL